MGHQLHKKTSDKQQAGGRSPGAEHRTKQTKKQTYIQKSTYIKYKTQHNDRQTDTRSISIYKQETGYYGKWTPRLLQFISQPVQLLWTRPVHMSCNSLSTVHEYVCVCVCINIYIYIYTHIYITKLQYISNRVWWHHGIMDKVDYSQFQICKAIRWSSVTILCIKIPNILIWKLQ